MKFYQLLQAYDFEEIFPEVNNMFPNAHLHEDVFRKAFEILQGLKPTLSKKDIRFQFIDNPSTDETFVGVPDTCFQTSWDVILGKELRKEKGVDLNDTQIVANCFLNTVLQSKHPQSFEKFYRKLMK
ncbi:MAG: hypothetical protein PUD15_03080 [Prevotella sp.]|uniref:hypothetical protein n=1 Tax=Prevotella sp. AGR2160 TaxID=1280674 RepID=UPI0003F4CE3A|nr:hypothetical protein [Prevotella sp. AGR2160]MDD5861529.1 hypothetical protein [Prevotella sp.]